MAVPTFAWHGSSTENMCHFKTKDFCSFIMYTFERFDFLQQLMYDIYFWKFKRRNELLREKIRNRQTYY